MYLQRRKYPSLETHKKTTKLRLEWGRMIARKANTPRSLCELPFSAAMRKRKCKNYIYGTLNMYSSWKNKGFLTMTVNGAAKTHAENATQIHPRTRTRFGPLVNNMVKRRRQPNITRLSRSSMAAKSCDFVWNIHEYTMTSFDKDIN